MTQPLLRLAVALVAVALIPAGIAGGATSSGRAWAWGDNADGELGNGTITRYGGIATPGQVGNLAAVTAVVGGSNFSLALTSEGTVWAWGNNGWGQLGQGTYGGSAVPVRVSGLGGVTAIAAGYLHALALKSDGSVWSWGFNYYGEVGNGKSGENVLLPVRVGGLSGVVAVSAGHGGDSSYALKSDGTVWAWGYDGLGQLGNGTSDENAHPAPVRVSKLSGAVAISAGSEHALALRSDGTVRAWGSNLSGELGARTTTTCSGYPCSTSPVVVRTLTGVTAVAGGGGFSLALKTDGSVWGWGDNGYGQLANGTTSLFGGVAKPTKSQLSSVIALAAGGQHTLALKSDGTVWAAGKNYWGQLGDGTFVDSSNPVQAVKLTAAAAIGAGLDHSLAVVP